MGVLNRLNRKEANIFEIYVSIKALILGVLFMILQQTNLCTNLINCRS